MTHADRAVSTARWQSVGWVPRHPPIGARPIAMRPVGCLELATTHLRRPGRVPDALALGRVERVADGIRTRDIQIHNRTGPACRTNPKPLCHFYFSFERALCKGTHTVA